MVKQDLHDLILCSRGKVRDLYQSTDGFLSDKHLLFVASDRISAFDNVMGTEVPEKGRLLTTMSEFWFHKLEHICRNHFVTTELHAMPACIRENEAYFSGRVMIVEKMQVLPVEAIVRGYITGSAWKEYSIKGTVHGIEMPKGLVECQALPGPLFSPSTKASSGEHDQNIHPSQCECYEFSMLIEVQEIVGQSMSKEIERVSLKLYAEVSHT